MKKFLKNHNFITWFSCAVLLLIMATLCIPDKVVTREQRELALQKICLDRLKKLAVICRNYANANGGNFPADAIGQNTTEMLMKNRFLTEQETDLVLCPSTQKYFPASTCHFIPGVTTSMSKKMPCVIEKITNHDRMLGVIHVDGSVSQYKHNFQNYQSLFPLLSRDLPEAEKQLLKTHLKRLDIPR
ncbi:MAG: hypothetical protein IKB16_02690 [Lentisphaeria bacterium]|nr:hypothetical protein [Lentisphaeria bacterium]